MFCGLLRTPTVSRPPLRRSGEQAELFQELRRGADHSQPCGPLVNRDTGEGCAGAAKRLTDPLRMTGVSPEAREMRCDGLRWDQTDLVPKTGELLAPAVRRPAGLQADHTPGQPRKDLLQLCSPGRLTQDDPAVFVDAVKLERRPG